MSKDAIPFVERRSWGWLVLFTSATTLVCCALPIALVTLGFGAVSAALFANLPLLTVLAENKLILFGISGVAMALAAWLLFRPGRFCPTDPKLAAQCASAHRWNTWILSASFGIWLISLSAAYLALPIYLWLQGSS